ncbi:MAG: DUF4254 domain-containing protein [Planctomycetales bacterium]|nr:DUF4254 domain-containing protein [Planctomycetales bacterium]
MFKVNEILMLHQSTVAIWHRQSIENTYSGPLETVCQQHIFNFELWHQEDIARSPTVSDSEIANVKRAIDKLNQARNDYIEKLDDLLTEFLFDSGIRAMDLARQNTETPGSVIDRLSIMSLRLFHYQEQLERDDAEQAHIEKVAQRIELCQRQKKDLSQSLDELLDDILSGKKIHRTYRQMKMYNDPTLNPYLYQRSPSEKVRC